LINRYKETHIQIVADHCAVIKRKKIIIQEESCKPSHDIITQKCAIPQYSTFPAGIYPQKPEEGKRKNATPLARQTHPTGKFSKHIYIYRAR